MLFDLEKDITEDSDVAADNPDVIRQIGQIMLSEHQQPEIERFDIFKK